MELNGKSCLITGGAGFIGSHLADNLMAKGCKVRVFDNLSNGRLENIAHHLDDSRFEFVCGSITDPLLVEKAVENIEVVFHLACLGVRHSLNHPFENHRVNAEGTLIVLEAALKAKVGRFLYCSSSEVYGTAEKVPMDETHPARPCTVYGASKLAGEAYARAYHKTYAMDVVIIRPFNTYGPRSHHEGDSGEVIPKSIVRALNGVDITVYGDGSQTRDFTYVTDVAEGLSLAAASDGLTGLTLNMGSNFEISIKELVCKIRDLAGNPESNVRFTPGRPGDVLRLYADPSAFMQLSGWRPEVDFDTGLRKTLDFFKGHPSGIKGLMLSEGGRSWEK